MGPVIRRIQIFGERCSGTNFLGALLAGNLPQTPVRRDFGWKHGFHPPGVAGARDCLFIVISRNPFDWLRSLHRRPFHAAPPLRGTSLSQFIRTPWWSVWDEDASRTPADRDYGAEMMAERNPDTGERFENVLHMRTAKIRDWELIGRKAPHTEYLRYEDLAAQPELFIEGLADRFGLGSPQGFYGVEGSRGGSRRYRPRQYPPIRSRDIDFILANLDASLEQRVGYDIRSLAEEARSEGAGLLQSLRKRIRAEPQ